MADAYLRQSPLAHLQLFAADAGVPEESGVAMREHTHRTMVTLRGDASDEAFRAAVAEAVGMAPPAEALTAITRSGRTILWMGPDEWLVVAPAEDREQLPAELDSALASMHAATVEVGESMTVIALAGPRAGDVLAKGCTINLHPSVFGPGNVVRTLLAKTGIVLHQLSDTPSGETPTYEIYIHRSFADYAWRWLADAGLEYGVAIAGG